MTDYYLLLSSSNFFYCVVSVIDSLLLSAGCALACAAVLKLTPRKHMAFFIAAAVLAAINGGIQTISYLQPENEDLDLLVTAIEALCPFVCMLLIYPKKGIWKAMLLTLGLIFAEELKYILLISFTDFDLNNEDKAMDLAAQSTLSLILFALILGFFLFYARKRNSQLAITKINIPLYIMIVITTFIFLDTMLQYGLNFSGENRKLFLYALSNIPLFAVTVTLAVRTMLKSKLNEENYRRMLEMQVRHYEQMERKNEELKVFRHDFPKKIRPLRLYLSDGRNDEAEKILDEFSASVEASRPRYSTGSFRLDTVLECEQQIAEQDGINIVFTSDSVFPDGGIAPEDIYTIFPNALDNAIEACRKYAGEREISVSSMVRSGILYICITNPFTGKAISGIGIPETTKADKERHGFGLKSIKKAAAKYGSDNVMFLTENGKFTLQIMLELNSPVTL